MFVKKFIGKKTQCKLVLMSSFFDNAPKKVNWKQAVKSRLATLQISDGCGVNLKSHDKKVCTKIRFLIKIFLENLEKIHKT